MSWKPCPCCKSEPAHAIIVARDGVTGDDIHLRIPHAHRGTRVGWPEDAKAVRFAKPDKSAAFARVESEGSAGVTAITEDGEEHLLRHGEFEPVARKAKRAGPTRLHKSALKAGQRWITVHPNGPDEKGVPILIEDNKDGTHSVIGGAGGKLQHLRLTDVGKKDPEKIKARRAAKQRAERERLAALPEDQREAERSAKGDVKTKLRAAERDYIKKVRDSLGGVSEDLDPEKLKDLPEGARNILVAQHHRKQMGEAKRAIADRSRKVAEDAVADTTAKEIVRDAAEEDPIIADDVRSMASEELKLQDEERAQKATQRRRGAARVTGDSRVGEKATRAALTAIREQVGEDEPAKPAPAPTTPPAPTAPPDATFTDEEVVHRGPNGKAATADGTEVKRGDDGKWHPVQPAPAALPPAPTPSAPATAAEEVRQQANEARRQARAIAKAALGEQLKPEEEAIVAKAKESLDLSEEDDEEETKAALAAEAARMHRRSQVKDAQAARVAEIAAEKGEDAAQRAVAYSAMITQVTGTAAMAKKMGLADTEQVPLKEQDVAAFQEALKSAAALRQMRKQAEKMIKAAEEGDYARARQAFAVDLTQVAEDATLSAEDEIRRALAENIRGVAARDRPAYMHAVASGNYDALADAGLGIAGQRYLDRPTVDLLGQEHSATLMRWAMERDGHDAKKVLAAIDEHHVKSAEEITAKALAKADKYAPNLRHSVETHGDIETALAHMDMDERDLDDAQQAIGSALGRMEGTAALGEAFRRKMPDRLSLPIGDSLDSTLQWLHSVGLKEGQFQIDQGSKQVHIPQEHWGSLVNSLPADKVKQRNDARAIKAGAQDEQGWLPAGITTRAKTTFTDPAPAAPRSWEPMKLGADPAEGVRNHVGARLSDGERPADIMSDLLSPKSIGAAPDRDGYLTAVRAAFPITDKDGKPTKFEDHAEHFRALADDYQNRRFGSNEGALHAQDIGVDDPKTHEAIFRALAQHPRAVHAYTPTGQLDHEGQRALRDHFYERMGIDPAAKASDERFQQEMIKLGPRPDPRLGTQSLFGGGGPSYEFRQWERARDQLLTQYPRQGLKEVERLFGKDPDPDKIAALKEAAANQPTDWEKYVEAHGSLELAQRALQDEIRHGFNASFRDHHARLTGRPLKTGVAEITNVERHIRATAGEDELTKLRAEAQATYAKLRDRAGGKFAAEGEGAVKEKFTNHLEQETIAQQNQVSMFGARSMFGPPKTPDGPPELRKPGPGERLTLGDRAEQQITSLMPTLGQGFKRGEKLSLFAGLNMDGERIHQQRVVKMLAHGKRLGAWLGTGSGKSLTSIGAFTHEHAAGNATHGLYLVPKAVEDQFGGEMLRYTDPGKYRWETGGGKDHQGRMDMLKGDAHMKVMTHESFRDTMLRAVADHQHGGDIDAAKATMAGASPADRAAHLRRTLDHHGIKPWFLYGDEAHRFTKRGDGEAAGLHLVASAASHPTNATHALFGTATPVKNSEDELHSMAAMLDPETYGDRHAFLQNYGQNLSTNPDAVRRELDHLVYTARVDPEGVDRNEIDNPRVTPGGMFGPAKKTAHGGPLPLSEEHKAHIAKTEEAYANAQKAAKAGGVDVDAMKHLSPSQFEGQPEDKHEEIARRLGKSLGIIRESAMRRAINQAPPAINSKLHALAQVVQHDVRNGEWTDRDGKTQRGKPSIVFTDSKAEAEMIHKHLTGMGMRSALYHGELTGKERESIRQGFSPEGGAAARHDVVVATSAAEAGINMQRAKVIHHFDVPQTEKSHAQRTGRAYRQGQQGDVDVHNWYADHPHEEQSLRRLKRKSDLASVMQDPFAHLDEHGIAGAYSRQLGRTVGAVQPI